MRGIAAVPAAGPLDVEGSDIQAMVANQHCVATEWPKDAPGAMIGSGGHGRRCRAQVQAPQSRRPAACACLSCARAMKLLRVWGQSVVAAAYNRGFTSIATAPTGWRSALAQPARPAQCTSLTNVKKRRCERQPCVVMRRTVHAGSEPRCAPLICPPSADESMCRTGRSALTFGRSAAQTLIP